MQITQLAIYLSFDEIIITAANLFLLSLSHSIQSARRSIRGLVWLLLCHRKAMSLRRKKSRIPASNSSRRRDLRKVRTCSFFFCSRSTKKSHLIRTLESWARCDLRPTTAHIGIGSEQKPKSQTQIIQFRYTRPSLLENTRLFFCPTFLLSVFAAAAERSASCCAPSEEAIWVFSMRTAPPGPNPSDCFN